MQRQQLSCATSIRIADAITAKDVGSALWHISDTREELGFSQNKGCHIYKYMVLTIMTIGQNALAQFIKSELICYFSTLTPIYPDVYIAYFEKRCSSQFLGV